MNRFAKKTRLTLAAPRVLLSGWQRTLAAGLVLAASCAPTSDADLRAGAGPDSAARAPGATEVSQRSSELFGKDGVGTVATANTVINRYADVKSDLKAGDKLISVTSVADLGTLGAGDLILVVQMQGATIDTTDTISYGTVTSYNGAGTYEFANVTAVNTATNQIQLDACGGGLKNAYSAAAHTQVVRVPQYTTLNVVGPLGSITAPAWNGKTGGIVALHASTAVNFTLGGAIDVTGKGFRAGQIDNDTSTAGAAVVSIYRSASTADGAEKGESIAGYQAEYTNGRYGRGAPANGGGGGNGHNAGGGGGANGNGAAWNKGQGVMDPNAVGKAAWALDPSYVANANKLTTDGGGGRGGYTFSNNNADALVSGPGSVAIWAGDGRQQVGGLGGHPVDNAVAQRLFLGGGGGAGDGNNGANGPGGAGGGLVFVFSPSVSGAGKIVASGADGSPTSGGNNDAPGGGGGGGTVVVAAGALSGITVTADGGKGGNQLTIATEAEGPGGGGGGGYIALAGGTVTTSTAGGKSGTTQSGSLTEFPVNGATDGNVGMPSVSASPIATSFPAVVCPSGSADLSVTISDNVTGGAVQPGGSVQYTVTVKNNSTNNLTGVGLSDTLPAGVMASSVGWTCAPQGGGTCQAASGTGNVASSTLALPGGASVVYTVTVPVPANAAGFFNYAATVSPPTGVADPNTQNNAATDSRPVAAANLPATSADLSIKLSHAPQGITPGGDVTYTALVNNAGPDVANNVQVALSFPAGSTVKTPPSGNGWTCFAVAPLSYLCNRTTAAAGDAPAITAVITAPASPDAGGLVASGAVSAVKNTDPNPGNNSATDVARVPVVDVVVGVSDNLGGKNIQPGSAVGYTVTISSVGNSDATGVKITDSLPAGVTIASWTCTATGGAQCPAGSGTGSIGAAAVNLPAGSSLTYQIQTAPVPDNKLTTVDYAVSAQPAAGISDPTPANNQAVDSHLVDNSAVPATGSDLSLTITHAPQKLLPGGDVTYTAQATNGGPAAVQNAQVVFSVPPGSRIKMPAAGTGWSCTQTGETAVCTQPSLAVGSATPIKVVITAPTSPAGGGQPVARGTIEAARNTDPTPANNRAVDVGSLPQADLSLSIARSPESPQPGSEVTYTLTARNGGPDDALNPSVVFTVPAGGEVTMPAAGDGWSCAQSGSTFTCTRPSLPGGEAPPILIKVKLPAAPAGSTGTPGSTQGTPALVGQVGAPYIDDPDLANNRAVSDGKTAPRTRGDLGIELSRDPAAAVPGQVVTYTAQATNSGPDTVYDPTVTFAIPPGSVVVRAAQGDGWACQQAGETVTCVRPDAPAGSAPPITIKVVTPLEPSGSDAAPGGAVYGSIAAVRNDDPNPANDTDVVNATNLPPTSADLAIALSRSPESAQPGQEVTITAQVKNKGTDTANNVVVALSVPPDTQVTQAAQGDGWRCAPNGQVYVCARDQLAVGDAPPITLKVITPSPYRDDEDPMLGATVTAGSDSDVTPEDNTARTPIGGGSFKLAGGGFGCTVVPGAASASGWFGLFATAVATTLIRRRRRAS